MTQIISNGIALGALYALLSLSFWVIFVTARTFHLAHVTVLNYSAYAIYTAIVVLHWPVIAAIPVAMIVAASMGVLIEWSVYQPIRKRGGEDMVIFVSSIAVLLIGQALLALMFGEASRGVSTTVPPPVLRTANVTITRFDTINVALALGLGGAVWLMMKYTRRGQSMRAVQENPELAQFFGFNVPSIYRQSFLFGSLLLVAPATLLALRSGVNPNLGFTMVLIAIIAVIAGGTESLVGAMLAAFFLGLLQNISLLWLAAEWQTVVTFSTLFVVLLIRPHGLRAAVEVRTVR